MMIYGTYGFNAFPDRHQGISGTSTPSRLQGPQQAIKGAPRQRQASAGRGGTGDAGSAQVVVQQGQLAKVVPVA